jgi:hypothetical protein
MDRSLGTASQPRIQNVTQQIAKSNIIYGASVSANPAYTSANKSLNYSTGGSIHSPELERISIIPLPLEYQDTVGLFGKENHFIRVDVQINREVSNSCFEEIDWECGHVTDQASTSINTYNSAIVNSATDTETLNDYEPAEITANSVPNFSDPWITVDLENLKTGNKYIDVWFDVRLYKSNREEHPYNKMFVREKDFFYIGFHARNTKRLPYNVKCMVGQELVFGLKAEDQRYINS